MRNLSYRVYDDEDCVFESRDYDEALKKANELYYEDGVARVSVVKCLYNGQEFDTEVVWENGDEY